MREFVCGALSMQIIDNSKKKHTWSAKLFVDKWRPLIKGHDTFF